MNTESLLACGVVFRSTADPEAGWKLVEGLESRDPLVRMLAQTFLVEGGATSLNMLETALSAGVVSTDVVSLCIAEILLCQRVTKVRKTFTDRDLC
jgi:hypothetical protein